MSETLALRVNGMTCDSCARDVEEALVKVPGVRAPRSPTPRARQARA